VTQSPSGPTFGVSQIFEIRQILCLTHVSKSPPLSTQARNPSPRVSRRRARASRRLRRRNSWKALAPFSCRRQTLSRRFFRRGNFCTFGNKAPEKTRKKSRCSFGTRSRAAQRQDVAAGRVGFDAYATTPSKISYEIYCLMSSTVLLVPNLYIPNRLHDAPKLRFLPRREHRLLRQLFFSHGFSLISAVKIASSNFHRGSVGQGDRSARIFLRKENCRAGFDLLPDVLQNVHNCL
jgi:hypothetical protein